MIAVILNIILGLSLMVIPSLLNLSDSTAQIDYILGPLIITFSIISIWDVVKSVLRLNLLCALLLLIFSIILPYPTLYIKLLHIFIAILVAVFSFFVRKNTEAFAGGWAMLFRKKA